MLPDGVGEELSSSEARDTSLVGVLCEEGVGGLGDEIESTNAGEDLPLEALS